MIQIDRELTAARRFEDEKSVVYKDGREWLCGLDWKARKLELWKRCGGKCEAVISGATDGGVLVIEPWHCQAKAVDPHHLIRRSVKRDDRLENLQALCRFHHDQLDKRKPRFGESHAKA